MKTGSVRNTLAALAITLSLIALPSHALAPLLAMLGKKMLQDILQNSLKYMLLESVSGMGCKGTALANGIRSLGNLNSVNSVNSVKGMGAGTMPNMTAIPNIRGMPGIAGMPGMPGIAGLPGMPTMSGAQPELLAKMYRLMPDGISAGGLNGGLTAEQAQMLAALTGGAGAPVSPQETMGTIDEMAELGLLPAATASDLKDCLLLVPQSAPALGMAMGMMKSVLPQVREGRDQMRLLSPIEQDELAAVLAQDLDKVPVADREQMLTGLRGGLFPPRVVDALNKRYGVP